MASNVTSTLSTTTQSQLGAMGQWAGFTFPTQSVPLNGVRQGVGKYWRGQDDSATQGTRRQLGVMRSTNYRCIQSQTIGGGTNIQSASVEHINAQGNFGGGNVQDGIAVSVGTSSFLYCNGQFVRGGGGKGGIGGAGGPARQSGFAGDAGRAAVSSVNPLTLRATATLVGGGGGGGGGGGIMFAPNPVTLQTRGGGGGGGGGGAGFGAPGPGAPPGAQSGTGGQGGQVGFITTGGLGGNAGQGQLGPAGAGGAGGGLGQAGTNGQATGVPGGAGGAAGPPTSGAITIV